ncbi:MAG: RNA 2',3'-cyclic phosphodiesterase [Synergistaceae bacterium]|nr:RNA 2',3'-cyclic phosphodiesterase [Synergistaceae bacterium]
MPELIRAFVAVKLPGNVADELENFLAELRPLAPIRWVRREQFHITLKFLGELPHEDIEQVKELLEPMKYFDPFTMRLDYIGAFPNLSVPRTLWLSGKQGAYEISRIAYKVDDVLCSEMELPHETKKFRAHLTLARLKDDYRLPEAVVRKLGEIPPITFECSELFLMRSQLTPGGPIYSQLL